MGIDQHGVTSKVKEQDTNMCEKSTLDLGEVQTNKTHDTCQQHAGNSEAVKPLEAARDSHSIPYIYRQDVVMSNSSGLIGLVTEVAGDSDSDSSIDDDDVADEDDEDNDKDDGDSVADENREDNKVGNHGTNESADGIKGGGNDRSNPLPPDQFRVVWTDSSETTQKLCDVTVIDRGFLHGDFVAAASDPTGQLGVVVDVNISVDLFGSKGSRFSDVSSKDLKRVRDFTVGDYVVLGPWLGRIDDVLDNVTVLFDDGSVCKVLKTDPIRLKPVGKYILEDGHSPFYPGQRVRASSKSVLKTATWLAGSWKPNRMEGTVTKVTIGSVYIYWITSAGYGADSSVAPAEEQGPKNLKLLSCFSHANWQLSDWCLLPSTLASFNPLDNNLPKFKPNASINGELDPAQLETGCGSEDTLEVAVGHEESMDIDSEAALDGNSENSESNPSADTNTRGNSLSVSKELFHETWSAHRKKIRKIVVRRDRKSRKKEESFQEAFFIGNIKTRVDVIWQAGNIECGLESKTLIPIDSPGDHEFVAEQYVMEKASDDNDNAGEVRRVGVVQSVNAKDRTACVKWFKPVVRAEDPREFNTEEVVSVYELEGHPDYDYCYGDVVVRLSPLSVSEQTTSQESAEVSKPETCLSGVKQDLKRNTGGRKVENLSGVEGHLECADLSWVGNITALKNGDIEVTWANGSVSTVGPQAVYVVGRNDDDESIGISDDGASWETVDDDEMDSLENAAEESQSKEATNATSQGEEITKVGESMPERNGALSLPLAALGFVTKLATGIFSRGQKNINSVPSVDEDESERQSSCTLTAADGRSSSNKSTSQKSDVINSCGYQTNQGTDQEHLGEVTSLLDVGEPICISRPETADTVSSEVVVSDFKRFDIAIDPSDHFFLSANGQSTNGRKWLKKVQQDWSILQNNLPNGIYVRAYEDRMDLLRAVIVGAYGTPYQDGLFFFDFHLPPDYPDEPPSAYYHSGGWRINPNLYEEGKVCLSLLNTWTGRGNEVWDPLSSSILQVLVSLQGLVLNSKPYFNEAGYDKQVGTAEGEKNSLSYNENTFLLNCKTMMYLMRKPPKDFEGLIKTHFKRRGHHILKACDAYMKGYLIGSLTEDAIAIDKSDTNATSIGFKLMLSKIAPKLYSALNEVGADCHNFKHLL